MSMKTTRWLQARQSNTFSAVGPPMKTPKGRRWLTLPIAAALLAGLAAGIGLPQIAEGYNVCSDPGSPCTHEVMTSEGLDLYLASSPTPLTQEIESHWAFIKDGVAIPDQFDPLYGNDGASGALITITHFWSPDDDLGAPMEFNQLGFMDDYPNAFNAAKALWSRALGEYASGNKVNAYRFLGMVAHFLGDQSIPTHVHNDTHGPDILDDDAYEEWMSVPAQPVQGKCDEHEPLGRFEGIEVCFSDPFEPNSSLCSCQFPSPRAFLTSAERTSVRVFGIPQGPWSDVQDQLLWIFLNLNQVADFFASDDEDGDSNHPSDPRVQPAEDWAQTGLDAVTLDCANVMNFSGEAGCPTSKSRLEDNDVGPLNSAGNNDNDGDLSFIRRYSYLRGIRAIGALFALWEEAISNPILTLTVHRIEERGQDTPLGVLGLDDYTSPDFYVGVVMEDNRRDCAPDCSPPVGSYLHGRSGNARVIDGLVYPSNVTRRDGDHGHEDENSVHPDYHFGRSYSFGEGQSGYVSGVDVGKISLTAWDQDEELFSAFLQPYRGDDAGDINTSFSAFLPGECVAEGVTSCATPFGSLCDPPDPDTGECGEQVVFNNPLPCELVCQTSLHGGKGQTITVDLAKCHSGDDGAVTLEGFTPATQGLGGVEVLAPFECSASVKGHTQNTDVSDVIFVQARSGFHEPDNVEVLLSVALSNTAPTVTLTGTSAPAEGTESYSFTTSDPGEDAFSLVSQSCGTAGLLSNASFDPTDGSGGFDCVFPDGPDTSTISVQVADSVGAHSNVPSIDVAISNVAPTVTASGGVIDENGVATVSGTITDPGSPDTFTVLIDWGEGALVSYAYPAGTTTFSETHQYLDDDPSGTGSDVYSIDVAVTDDDGGVGTADTSVTVDNVAPTVTASGAVIDENGVATVSGTITDPGSLDTFVVMIDWGEGAPVSYSYPAGATIFSETHQYLDDNPTGSASDVYSIDVTVTDDDGGVGTADTNVTVNNVAPVVTASGAVIDENGVATVSGTITDPGSLDSLEVMIDWGEGAPVSYPYPAGATAFSETHQYLDDNPTGTASDTYLIAVFVTDDDTGMGEAATTVIVKNVAPTVTATGTVIDENGVATVSGTITDPGSVDTFVLMIDWGEGAPESYAYPAGATAFAEAHQYLDDNPTGTPSDSYLIAVIATDDDGGVGPAATAVAVNNVAPTASIDAIVDEAGNVLGEDIDIVLIGLDFDIGVSFSDVGTLDSHVVAFDWNDGTVNEGPATSPVANTHLYAATGTYTILVTVTDDDTGTVTVDDTIEVVDAAGAAADAIEDLTDLVNDPAEDPAAVALVQDVLDQLNGNRGGQAANGALDMLEQRNWNAAFVKLSKAIELLEEADPSTDVDLSIAVSQLVLAAKSKVVELLEVAKAIATKPKDRQKIAEAEALVAEGDQAFANGDALAAVEAYRTALTKLPKG